MFTVAFTPSIVSVPFGTTFTFCALASTFLMMPTFALPVAAGRLNTNGDPALAEHRNSTVAIYGAHVYGESTKGSVTTANSVGKLAV